MNLPCAVVRDLLPLYAEKMTEAETQKWVETHLEGCPACRQKLSEIETGPACPVDTAKPLLALKKQIRRRRLYAALIAGLFVFIAVFTYFCHAGEMKQVPWEDGLVEVQGIESRPYEEVFEDSGLPEEHESTLDVLVLRVDSRINGYEESTFIDDDGTRTEILQGWSTNPRVRSVNSEPSEIVYYPIPDRILYSYGSQHQLLWGEPLNGGVEVLPRLALAYYLLIAAAGAAVSGAFWFLLRNREYSWIPRQVFLAPVSYGIAHLLIKGFRTASFFMDRDFFSIILMTASLYALFSLAWQIWLQRKSAV